jgi:hypothetical protein
MGGDDGFRMQLLPGWQAQLTKGGLVFARSADGTSMVLIAPVTTGMQAGAAQWLKQGAIGMLQGMLPGATLSAVYPSRLGKMGALGSFDYRSQAGPGKAHVLCVAASGVGTMYLIAGPAAAFGQQRNAMIGMLRSFEFTGAAGEGQGRREPSGAGINVSWIKFVDPYEGAFSAELPSGWRTQGGLVRKSTVDVRGFIRTSSPDGAMMMLFGDPEIGTFVVPTPTLAATGFGEGRPYSPGYGSTMIVSRYLPGPAFAQQYVGKMAQMARASNVQVRDVKARPDLSSQLSGIAQTKTMAGEAAFTCMVNGRESVGYVLAATTLTSMMDTGIWNVSTLVGFIVPASMGASGHKLLQHTVASFAVSPQWYGRQQQTTAATSQIVSRTNEAVSRTISDSYWSRQRAQDRMSENYSDYIRGRVRLKDPDSGEELEGRAGKNYYWRVRGTDTIIGSDQPSPPPQIDVTELQEVG